MSNDNSDDTRQTRIQAQLRQLILMRETGPKRAAWHLARSQMIWRLHDELRQHADQSAADEGDPPNQA